MGYYLYLLPNQPINADPVNARDWLNREESVVARAPKAGVEARKRDLADLLLTLNPNYSVFTKRFAEIAQFENISIDDARSKYRDIEINGPSVQYTINDNHIVISVYSQLDMAELDVMLTVIAQKTGYVLFDPQTDEFTDLSKDTFSD